MFMLFAVSAALVIGASLLPSAFRLLGQGRP